MRLTDLQGDEAGRRLIRRAGPLLFGIYARQEVAGEVEVRAGGSGIFIAPFTGLTAKHVSDDFRRLDGRYPRQPNGTYEADYGAAVFQNPYLFDEDRTGIRGDSCATWQVNELWPAQFSDISVLQVSAEGGLSVPHQFELPTRPFEWMLTPPPVGSMVTALGFPDAKLAADGRILSIDSNFLFERGFVQTVHEVRRERGMLCFPCFEVDRPFPAGMSGGPVFFEDRLCGIVTSATNFDSRGYVASLWPLLRAKYGDNKSLEFRSLFRSGVIHSSGWLSIDRRITVEEEYEGEFCRLQEAAREADSE